jgi:hypothetical protein
MKNNVWLKLAAVSLSGIILSFVLLWGVNQFSAYNAGYGYNNMYIQGNSNGYMNTNKGMSSMMDDGM